MGQRIRETLRGFTPLTESLKSGVVQNLVADASFHFGRLNQTSLLIYFHQHDAAPCGATALSVFGILWAGGIDR